MMRENFSFKLKLLRKEKGFTQADLANAIGVARTSISNWEKGIRRPNMNIVTKLAVVFDVSVDYLVLSDHTIRRTHLSDLGIDVKKIAEMLK